MKRLLTAAVASILVFTFGGTAAHAASKAAAAIRVDQVGYATGEAKRAYLLSPAPAAGTGFTVRDDRGRTVLAGKVGASTGGWNDAYTAVHPIDFGALRAAGT